MTQLISNINVSSKNTDKVKKIDFKVFKFNDGSIKVRLATSLEYVKSLKEVELVFAPSDMTDAMIAMQMVSILRQVNEELVIDMVYASTLYTRYDRIMTKNSTDAFGLKVFISCLYPMLNQISTVSLLDVHNAAVLTNILLDVNPDLAIYQYSLKDLVSLFVKDPLKYHVVALDKGGEQRLKESGINCDIVFGKNRDPETDLVTLGYYIKTPDQHTKPYLVIDDIIEYGSTFNTASKKFRKDLDKILFVTYAILPTDESIINIAKSFNKIYIHICHESVWARIKMLIINQQIPNDIFIFSSIMEQAYVI